MGEGQSLEAALASPSPEEVRESRFLDQFLLSNDTLGEGASCTVVGCKERSTLEELAVKMIDRIGTPEHAVMKEVRILRGMHHRNIVKFHRIFYERCFFCIVMEKFQGDLLSGLLKHMKERGRVRCYSFAHVARQMAMSIRYVHSKKVVHRDIKGENYLLDRPDFTDVHCRVALTDFGAAVSCGPEERITGVAGTKTFWAPECWCGEYGPKVDTWALGIVLYTVMSGRYPFKTESEVMAKMLKPLHHTSPTCSDFIMRLIERNEMLRPSSEETMKHPWIVPPPEITGGSPVQITEESRDQVEADGEEEFWTDPANAMTAQKTSRESSGNVLAPPPRMPETGKGAKRHANDSFMEGAVQSQKLSPWRSSSHSRGSRDSFREEPLSAQRQAQRQISGNSKDSAGDEGAERNISNDSVFSTFKEEEATGHNPLQSPVNWRCSNFSRTSWASCSVFHQPRLNRLLRDSMREEQTHKRVSRESRSSKRTSWNSRISGLSLPEPRQEEPTAGATCGRSWDSRASFLYREDAGMVEKRTSGESEASPPRRRRSSIDSRASILPDIGVFQRDLGVQGMDSLREESESRGLSKASTLVAGEAVDDTVKARRVELINRLSKEHESQDKHEHNVRRFASHHLAERFTLGDPQVPQAKLTYEWWDQPEAQGLLDADARSDSVVQTSYAPEVDLVVFAKMLVEHGIDPRSFGVGAARPLQQLVEEVQSGAARLMLDATEHKKLVRVVDAVLLRLWSSPDAEGLFSVSVPPRLLIEVEEFYVDGRKRETLRLPGTKKQPHESTGQAVTRVLQSTLFMRRGSVEMDLLHVDRFEEAAESPSYPGVKTVYRKEIVDCVVIESEKGGFAHIGLPEFRSFRAETAQGQARSFSWMSEAHAIRQRVRVRPSDKANNAVSTLVHVPLGLSVDELHLHLTRHDVDATRFGEDGAASLEQFSAELVRGEAALLQDPTGGLMRVEHVVKLTLINPSNGKILVQRERLLPDGSRKVLDKIPGTRQRPDENHFLSARRLLRRQLRMDENQVLFDPEVGRTRESYYSATYPGLRMVCCKRLIKAQLVLARGV